MNDRTLPRGFIRVVLPAITIISGLAISVALPYYWWGKNYMRQY
jgi:uncharacterized membrane protein